MTFCQTFFTDKIQNLDYQAKLNEKQIQCLVLNFQCSKFLFVPWKVCHFSGLVIQILVIIRVKFLEAGRTPPPNFFTDICVLFLSVLSVIKWVELSTGSHCPHSAMNYQSVNWSVSLTPTSFPSERYKVGYFITGLYFQGNLDASDNYHSLRKAVNILEVPQRFQF